jgi:membrane protein DedA with SNARE-associated domain
MLHVLPGPTELLFRFGSSLESGSVAVLVLATVAENVVILNALFPFAVVILFAMASTHGHPSLALATFATIYVTGGLVQHLNFAIGRAWHSLARARQATANRGPVPGDTLDRRPRIVARGPSPLPALPNARNRRPLLFARGLLSYGHPLTGSTCSFDLGWFEAPYGDFLICWLIPSLLWNAGWGIAMYQLGAVPGSASSFVVIFYAYLIGLIIYRTREQRAD